MKTEISLVGQRFGRLLVIEETNEFQSGIYRYYVCQCDCGNIHRASSGDLRSGHTKSCKCLLRETARERRLKKSGEASFNALLRSYIRQASKRGYEFLISTDEFIKLTSDECFYCGIKPSGSFLNTPTANGAYIYNGIDRLDNSKGYVLGNVVPCCKRCNYAKNNMTSDEFPEWIGRIYNNYVIGKLNSVKGDL